MEGSCHFVGARASMVLSASALGLAGCAGDPTGAPASKPLAETCREPGTWRSGPELTDPREQAAALRLRDGRVLVAGGHPIDPGWRILDSAEIYDPAPDAWAKTGSMNAPRDSTWRRTALLESGKVLTVDQLDFSTGEPRPIPSELFDPTTETWSVTGSTGSGIDGRLVALAGGDALLVGGIDWQPEIPQATVFRYRAGTEDWAEVEPMGTPRTGHAVLLVGDEVLVVGGADVYPASKALRSAEVFDLKTNHWRAVGEMAEGRWMPGLAPLPDGRVLAAGGTAGNDFTSGSRATAEIYDPATGKWAAAGSMLEGRGMASFSVLHDGRILAVGGYGDGTLASAEFYDPARDAWFSAGTVPGARRLHTAATLESGEVLVIGGYAGRQLQTTAIYTPCRASALPVVGPVISRPAPASFGKPAWNVVGRSAT